MLNPILKMVAQRSSVNQCHTAAMWQSWHSDPSISVPDPLPHHAPLTLGIPLLRDCRAEHAQWQLKERRDPSDGTTQRASIRAVAWTRGPAFRLWPGTNGSGAVKETAKLAWSDKSLKIKHYFMLQRDTESQGCGQPDKREPLLPLGQGLYLCTGAIH